MANSARIIFYIFLTAVWCASCSQQISRDELVGNYKVDYGYGVEDLQLLPNGRYDQTFRSAADNVPITNTGKWELKSDTLHLYDSLIVDDNFGRLRSNYKEPVPGSRGIIVKKQFWIVHLIINPDSPVSFKKTN